MLKQSAFWLFVVCIVFLSAGVIFFWGKFSLFQTDTNAFQIEKEQIKTCLGTASYDVSIEYLSQPTEFGHVLPGNSNQILAGTNAFVDQNSKVITLQIFLSPEFLAINISPDNADLMKRKLQPILSDTVKTALENINQVNNINLTCDIDYTQLIEFK